MIALEPVTPAQAEVLALLHASAFPPAERWDAATMAVQLGLPTVFGWLAPIGGFVLARAVADEAEILTLAVAPETRRQGIARALLQQAVLTAGERGAERLFLEVAERNRPARALYTGLGMEMVARRRAYYRDGADALLLCGAIAYGSTARLTPPGPPPP